MDSHPGLAGTVLIMIDVNGTRHHLLLGRDDWLRAAAAGKRTWEYDDSREAVQLQAEIYAFGRGSAVETVPPMAAPRRGAARDSYGHWYWLESYENETSTRIMARWAAASRPEQLFPGGPAAGGAPARESIFQPSGPSETAEPELLAGLAVTADGYLVAGSPATGTLLVFDLYALDGGFLRVGLPAPSDGPHEPGQPFDLTALPGGGLLALDRTNKLVWLLDGAFRPVPVGATARGDLLSFQPKQGPARRAESAPEPQPIDLSATAQPAVIEPLPDGSFWVLDAPAESASVLWRYAADGSFEPQSVELLTANLVDEGADDLDLGRIEGRDIAYLPDRDGQGNYLDSGLLYVADVSGHQLYGLRVDLAGGLRLRLERRYYPLRRFSGAALIAVWPAGEAYYHQGTRWLPIKALPQMKYEAEAALTLPPFDGRDPACVWHRLCVDACIPPETRVMVESRAADTRADLQWQPWQEQPRLYRRPAGSEIPYYALWNVDELADDDTGTWELLFQQTVGRYMQLRLTLAGNGRSTPALRALRAHYPRFSYLQSYLPAVYHQDPGSRQFVENFLANPEGIFTTIEGLIAQVQVLLDVRAVPPDAVDWLGSWLGLALDPGWSDYQRRLLIAQAPYFFLRRGTLPGMLQAILLAVYPELGPDIFRDDLDCATIRIVERFLTRTRPGLALGDPTDPELTTTGNVLADATARAHQFVVLLPATIDAATQRLVERVVELEKPAHTAFTIKQYWALFRVGEVRLGIDTTLGPGGRSEAFRLGQTALAEGSLAADFPYSLTTRTVIAK